MNVLPREKQIQILTGLLEGCSIRSLERMHGIHRDTIMRLGVRVGKHCANLLDQHIRNVPAGMIQCDEQWGYVQKKDKRLTDAETKNPELGSQFIFVAMDGDTKLVLSHRIGKRTPEMALALMGDLRERIEGRPTIITDGFGPYLPAVETAFGREVDFGMLVKSYTESRQPVREGYRPARVVKCNPQPMIGKPERITTSHIERFNLTTRMCVRRMARLTNAFSKRLESLKAAIALHIAFYNFCRVHKTLRVTPAMQAGLASSIWTIQDLLPE
jgi:IS1 family transposase